MINFEFLQLGMYTLSIMTDISKSSYIVHAELFANLFSNVLTGLPELNSNVAYYTVVTMKNLVAVIGGHQQVINIYTHKYSIENYTPKFQLQYY